MGRNILHCDMNNFYASVECMLNPAIREKAVAVCGSVEERHGIVLAKNYAAKGYGVQTGDAIWQAKEKCPNLLIVPPHYDEYVKYSNAAKEIYCRFTDRVEPYGMDECWLDVTGSTNIFGKPIEIAKRIKETIKFELGLTISVGVSFNKIFAKLGSDMKKPDAITEISSDLFRTKIWGLPACDLLGVGPATQRSLCKLNVNTIGDLAQSDPDILKGRLGKNGLRLWAFANGLDVSPVMPYGFEFPVKSVGHGTTMTEDITDNNHIWMIILELSQEIGHRLRVHGKLAQGVSVYVRDSDLNGKQWQCKMDYAVQSSILIARSAYDLFKERYNSNKAIRSITIQAINLISQDEPQQIMFGYGIEKMTRQERLDSCVDIIRKRYGNKAIQNAILFQNLKLPATEPHITMPSGVFR